MTGIVVMSLQVFEHYQKLLNSENYVTRRQSLKVCANETTLEPLYKDTPEIRTPLQKGHFLLPQILRLCALPSPEIRTPP